MKSATATLTKRQSTVLYSNPKYSNPICRGNLVSLSYYSRRRIAAEQDEYFHLPAPTFALRLFLRSIVIVNAEQSQTFLSFGTPGFISFLLRLSFLVDSLESFGELNGGKNFPSDLIVVCVWW